TFEAQLFYGDLKAIVKTSHLVKIDYPKFIVHGKKGSFIKYGICDKPERWCNSVPDRFHLLKTGRRLRSSLW
ncbi:hypothetical protein E2K62_22950, partial [Escherichia coli]